MIENTCCFIGHRRIEITDELKINLYNIVEYLIREKKVDRFLLGSNSMFNDLCYIIITDLKKYYPHIKRIYVRSNYPHLTEEYKSNLLEKYEETYYPNHIRESKYVYIQRNYEMIDKSKYCIFYYDESYSPIINMKHQSSSKTENKPKSGTKIAYQYAQKKKKEIINMF